jgi:hypothetical protein
VVASFPCSSDAYHVLVGPYHGAGSPNEGPRPGRRQELLTRLNYIRDSMEAALGDIKGIEDDYRRGLLEAHIRGAIREINAQITELVSSRR